MADPLSIAASILALLEGGGTVARGLRKVIALKRAPERLMQLNNEVADLQRVVSIVQDAAVEYEEDTRAWENLTIALEKGKSAVLDLESFIAYHLIKADRGTVRYFPFLKDEGKIERRRQRIHDAKQDIQGACSIMNFTKHRVQPQEIIVKVSHEEQHLRQMIQQILGPNVRIFVEQEQISDARLITANSNDAVEESFMSLEHLETGVTAQDQISTESTHDLHSLNDQLDSLDSPDGTQIAPTGSNDTLKLSGWSCGDLYCRCLCHKRVKYRTPKIFDGVLGSLFIGYSALPPLIPNCNVARCNIAREKERNARSPRFSFSYTFPAWFLDRVVQVRINSPLHRPPELLLRLLRRRPADSPFFNYCSEGQVDKIRHCLENGEGSLLDVCDRGLSGLHYAAMNEQQGSMRLLISCGADVTQEDFNGCSLYAAGWLAYFVLRDIIPEAFKGLLKAGPEYTMDTELMGFTELHAALIDTESPEMMDTVLAQASLEDLEIKDRLGFTVLTWAAVMGNTELVKKLLQHGASPNTVCNSGNSALHILMADYADIPMLELLANAGADVHFRGFRGGTLFHAAVGDRVETKFLDWILRWGVDIDAVDNDGDTALNLNLLDRRNRRGEHETCKRINDWLLDHGANPDIQSQSGWTAIMLAISKGQNACLRSLLLKNANTSLRNESQETILHLVARDSSIETLDILTAADLSDVDVDAANKWGNTALEIAWNKFSDDDSSADDCDNGSDDDPRDDSDDDSEESDSDSALWFKAFEKLISGIRDTQNLMAAKRIVDGSLCVVADDQDDDEIDLQIPGGFPSE